MTVKTMTRRPRKQSRRVRVDTQLAQLENAQLVRRAADVDLAYIFKHALTQEAAYHSLLQRQRRAIHRYVAETYEQLYPDQLNENAARLAQHYVQAGDDAKALAYSTRAGDVAARVYADEEAIEHYTRALELARKNSSTPAEQIEYLYRRRGRELELASQFKPALASYQGMESFARERNERNLELSAIVAQSQILCTANSEFDPTQGEPLVLRALELARELNDRATEAKIQWILLNLYRFTDRFIQARQAGEESLAIARELDLREQMAFTLNDLPHVYFSIGEPARCYQMLQQAIGLWRELGNLPMLADSLSSAALSGGFTGQYDQVLAFADEALQISKSIGNLWGQTYSLSTVGPAYWARGEPDRAIEAMEETLRLSEQSGYPIPQVITRADLGVVLANLGARERANQAARLALASAETHYRALRPYPAAMMVQVQILSGDVAGAAATVSTIDDTASDQMMAVLVPLSRFQLAFAQSDYARALEMGQESLERVHRAGLQVYVPDILCMIGRTHRAMGNIDAARVTLNQSRATAESLKMRRILWQIYAALGEVEAQEGNMADARTFHLQALEVIEYIATHAPDDLRASFLALPGVRAVESE